MKIVIVGGVAAGASAAAKARRVNEKAEVILFEKGPYISFANCGLPYYIGGEISERRSLLIQTPENFLKRFNVKAHVLHEVFSIDRKTKKIKVKNLNSDQIFEESYDKLILCPGSNAVVPPIPGIKSKNIFVMKTVPDADAIKSYIREHHSKKSVVIGAGFIGLEAAENLKKIGLDVTIIEKLPQVLPQLDDDMARFVSDHLRNNGIEIILSDGIKAFHGDDAAREVELESGKKIPMELAILSIGVSPELSLAKSAGLKIGEAGGIDVDEYQQTSDPDIYAAGDAVEMVHLVTRKKTRIPLAGPANKQGRVAGTNAAEGKMAFPGAVGTAIVESLGITAAKCGLSERECKSAGIVSTVSLTHSLDHAGYYPNGETMHIKLIFEQENGKILGAQIVGGKGVDKRIDVFAAAIFTGMKVTDLENLDLAYAPQFSSAKDPVIMAGFVASNVKRNELGTITCQSLQEKLSRKESIQLLDVRTENEYVSGHLEGAVHIPVDELRRRLNEIDPGMETVVYCHAGLRGYIASRILLQNGFRKVLNLTGGILMCSQKDHSGKTSEKKPPVEYKGKVSVEVLHASLGKSEVFALDIREKDEYNYIRIDNTTNIPLSELEGFLQQLPKDKDIFVFCQTGMRTDQAIKILHNSGFNRVCGVHGGLESWRSAGYPVKRGTQAIPIVRQVHIIVGTMALIGGIFLSLRWLPIIVGAGLLFAGLTGKCGLAMVLSKLPWNKCPDIAEVENEDKGSCCAS